MKTSVTVAPLGVVSVTIGLLMVTCNVAGCERHTHRPTAEGALPNEPLPASATSPAAVPAVAALPVFDSVAIVRADAELRPMGYAAAALTLPICGPIEAGAVEAPIVEGFVDDTYHALGVRQPRSTCSSRLGTQFAVFSAGQNDLWAFTNETSAVGLEGGKILRYAAGTWKTLRAGPNREIVAGISWTGGRVLLALTLIIQCRR